MENKYAYKRPSSEQLEDFHIYVVPSNIWREKYNNMQNQDVTESISLGFIRIHPEAKIFSLREEIENQLDSPNLPEEYAFLKSVGRCLTKVKQHQEYQLKAKHFLPHFNSTKSYGSELYLLDTSMMETASNSDRNSSQATTENPKSETRSYEREITPKFNHGHKTKNGINNHNDELPYLQKQENPSHTSYQTYRHQTPVSFKQNIYSELSFQNALKQPPNSEYSPEEIGNLLPGKSYSTSPPTSPHSKLHSVTKNSMRRSSPLGISPVTSLPLVRSPYSSRRLINGRQGDHYSDSQLSEFSIEPRQKNIYMDYTGRYSQEGREVKHVGRDEHQLPLASEVELKQQRQEERAARQRQEEEKRQRERQAREQLEHEQKEQENWLRSERQRKQEEMAAEQEAAAKEAAAAAAAARSKAVEAAAAQMMPVESNFPNNTETKELEVTKNKRKEESERLLQELEAIREQRRAKERQREELVKRAKVLQARSQNKRNHARDIWKKKYYEEKKKTTPLEDQCNKLRQELESMHRKFIASLDPPKEKPARVSTKKPSEKNNILIQATRLKHATDDLHQRVENAKMKLTAELKLRNQAEVELRTLKAELIQQKINLNLLRKQQITSVVHHQGNLAPSSTGTPRENPPSVRQPPGMYTPRRQIPHI